MCKYNKLIDNNNNFNNLVGQKLRCRFNDHENDLCNNFLYNIINEDNEFYFLDNGYKLSKKKFNPFSFTSKFSFNYATTLYGIQGGDSDKIYWCKDDNKYLDNYSLYTLMSRIREQKI